MAHKNHGVFSRGSHNRTEKDARQKDARHLDIKGVNVYHHRTISEELVRVILSRIRQNKQHAGVTHKERITEDHDMNRLRLVSNLVMITFMALVFSATAHAQATRTWVSGVGDDANPCSRTAPCKTLAGAISKTAAGGEIDCLDPAGVGALTITKAITIDGGAGQVCSVLVSGTNAFNIAAGAADVVIIRNMTLDGLELSGTPGITGISITSAKAVHLENVSLVGGFSTTGVLVDSSTNTSLTMQDVNITDITGPGVSIGTSSGGVTALADLREVHIWNCAPGLLGQATSVVTVQNSIISMNGTAIKQIAGGSQINVINSQMNSNGNAMLSFSGSSIRSINNAMMQNGTAYNPNGGTISSDGQTVMGGNGSNGTANGPAITRM
jgi:hypothetical protein